MIITEDEMPGTKPEQRKQIAEIFEAAKPRLQESFKDLVIFGTTGHIDMNEFKELWMKNKQDEQ